MKIKQSILNKVNNPASRARIGLQIGCGDQMMYIHMRQNNVNGRLTKMDALMAISKEAGVTVEQVLDEDAKSRKAKSQTNH